MADNLQMMLKSVQQELKSIKEAQTRYEKEYTQKPSAAAAAAPSVSGSVVNQEGQLKSIRKAIENMDNILRKLEEDVWKNCRRIDDLEQYSRRNCLILHGCKIPAQESYSEFESYVIHKLNSKLEISPAITTHDIDTCHVLPSRKKSSNTPIIIKFVRRSVRNAIYAMKKKLKAKKNDDEKLSITEFLTRRRLQLLRSAKQTFGLGSAWTLNGNVYCMHKNKRYIIDDFNDIDKLIT